MKSEECTKFPHLFYDPLDNEPLMACFKASGASIMLNKQKGSVRMDDALPFSLVCPVLIIKRLSRQNDKVLISGIKATKWFKEAILPALTE